MLKVLLWTIDACLKFGQASSNPLLTLALLLGLAFFLLCNAALLFFKWVACLLGYLLLKEVGLLAHRLCVIVHLQETVRGEQVRNSIHFRHLRGRFAPSPQQVRSLTKDPWKCPSCP